MLTCKKLHIISALIILVALPLVLASCRTKHQQKVQQTPVEQTMKSQEKAILFNLNGVLIKEDTGSILNKVGYALMASYALTHWRNPVDSCLDVLEKMAAEPDQKSTINFKYKNRKMPRCVIEWQQGKSSYQTLKKELEQYVARLDQENFFSSAKEKEITLKIMNIALDPDELAAITKPVIPMLTMVEELKAKGYKLYIFANAPQEAVTFMKNTYPNVVNLFDGIIVSAEAKAVKPQKKIFRYLLTTHNLDPKRCIIIDDESNSLDIAHKFGMKGVPFTNPKGVKNKLKKLGII